MAKFTPSQIDIDRINGGNRYQNGDFPTPETFNAPIEAAIFAQSLATNQPNVENANNIGVPSVNIEQVTDGGVRFVFSNLKGEKGQDGKDHSQEIASLNSQIYTANDKISRLTKEVSNLESQLNPDLVVFDKQIAYAKEVPIRSAPYAEITKFGGMSYKSKNKFNVNNVIEFNNLTYSDGVFTQITADTREEQYFKAQKIKDGKYVGEAFSSFSGYVGILKGSLTIDGTFDTLIFGFGGETRDTSLYVDITNLANGTYYLSINCTNITQGSVSFRDVMLSTEDVPYEPYFEGLRHAKPTAFKSVGANLWSVGDIVSSGYTYDITNVFEHLTPNKQYALSWTYSSNGTSGTQNLIIIYTEAGGFNIANGALFTITEEQINTFTSAYAYFGSDATSGSMTNIMLNEGETALPYKPYREPITLAIPTAVLEKFDGYGKGRVYNFIDWSAKKYHKTCGVVDLGTLDWYNTSGFMVSGTGLINAKAFNNEVANILCAKYISTSYNGLNPTTNKYIAIRESDKSVWVMDADYTDGSAFKEAMQGVMLVYELATPEVTDISDILPDDNLIAVEGGGTIIAENEYGYAVPSEIVYQLMSAGGTGGGSSLPQYLGEYEVIE